ncbi:unnamed protein product, partial [Iphiclides podalirius]
MELGRITNSPYYPQSRLSHPPTIPRADLSKPSHRIGGRRRRLALSVRTPRQLPLKDAPRCEIRTIGKQNGPARAVRHGFGRENKQCPIVSRTAALSWAAVIGRPARISAVRKRILKV